MSSSSPILPIWDHKQIRPEWTRIIYSLERESERWRNRTHECGQVMDDNFRERNGGHGRFYPHRRSEIRAVSDNCGHQNVMMMKWSMMGISRERCGSWMDIQLLFCPSDLPIPHNVKSRLTGIEIERKELRGRVV